MFRTLDFLVDAWTFLSWFFRLLLAGAGAVMWGAAFVCTGWFPIIAAEQAAKWEDRLLQLEWGGGEPHA